MRKFSPRSLLQARQPMEVALPGASSQAVGEEGTSRRAFLQGGAGAAAGAAVIIATPKVAAIVRDGSGAPEPRPVATEPSGPGPREPIAAYVRDAERGEVTVMFGKQETTYRDPALVRRLLEAAR